MGQDDGEGCGRVRCEWEEGAGEGGTKGRRRNLIGSDESRPGSQSGEDVVGETEREGYDREGKSCRQSCR